jgi:DNA-binding MarR family transcriptional regulator
MLRYLEFDLDQLASNSSAEVRALGTEWYLGRSGMAGRSREAGSSAGAGRPAEDPGVKLDLQQYFPYRLARLAEQVSLAVAEVYSERFALTRQEWRVLAILGTRSQIATKEIGPLTTLDKMQVSRAVQGLEARGIVSRTYDLEDRRERIVSLTPAGRALYRNIVPYALKREAMLLGVLTPQEIKILDRAMRRLSDELT